MNLLATLLLVIVAFVLALLSSSIVGNSNIHFISLTPKTDRTLTVGSIIKVQAEASYKLRGEIGRASFYVQDRSVVLAKRDIKLNGKSGVIYFEVPVFVPRSEEFTVILALFEAGEDRSLVNERLKYNVKIP